MAHVPAEPGTGNQPLPASAPQRKAYLDLLRVLGGIAVVVAHVTAQGVARPGSMSLGGWWAFNVFDSASRWCVPIFVMISGALLLANERQESAAQFYRRRLARLGLPLVFWSVFYLAWRWYWKADDRPAVVLLEAVLRGEPYYHLYFLFLIAGLYVFTPMLRVALRAMDRPMQVSLAVLCLAVASLSYVLGVFLERFGNSAVDWFVPYVGYYIAGFVLDSRPPSTAERRVAAVGFCASILLTALAVGETRAFDRSTMGLHFFYSFQSPLVVLGSVCLFLLAKGWFHSGAEQGTAVRIVGKVAPLILGIYLIHPVFLDLLIARFSLPVHPYAVVAIPAWSIVLFVAALVCTKVIEWIPGVRRIVG